MQLTILVDNYCNRSDLLAEYGFSVHIKSDNNKEVLMDTGQGRALYSNAYSMNINLNDTDHIVFSHGHFDHIWGAPKLLEKTGDIPVWAHPDFDRAKYRKKINKTQYIGSYIKKEDLNFHPIKGVTLITENIWGVEVPYNKRNQEYTPTTEHLKILKGDNWEEDTFPDDISLVVKGEYGYSVILGCAHAGVANILEEISIKFKTNKFYSVIGGMHMKGQSEDYVEKVIEKITKDYEVYRWIPTHCTGFKAASLLDSIADNVDLGGTGTVIKL